MARCGESREGEENGGRKGAGPCGLALLGRDRKREREREQAHAWAVSVSARVAARVAGLSKGEERQRPVLTIFVFLFFENVK
jgi:hypothetical protein